MGETSVLSNEIKVMVIDHKQDYLASVRDFLECNSFGVTSVHQAGAALSMLTTTKDKFDLLLIASDMSEVDAITFLRLTKNMDILSMVMCQGADDNFLLKVLENGGFRVVNTPLTDEVIMLIRQDVIRARFHKFKMTDVTENQKREQECESGQERRPNGCAKKKVRVEWTEEIHSRFIKAIHELGEKKCHPKNILELMGVPGLTRLQVASHLQKCRREVSKVLHGTPSSSSKKKKSSNVSREDGLRMFGNNPSFATHEDQIGTNIEGTFPVNGGTSYVNNQIIKDFSAMNDFGFGNQGVVSSVPPIYNQVMLTQGTSEFTQNI